MDYFTNKHSQGIYLKTIQTLPFDACIQRLEFLALGIDFSTSQPERYAVDCRNNGVIPHSTISYEFNENKKTFQPKGYWPFIPVPNEKDNATIFEGGKINQINFFPAKTATCNSLKIFKTHFLESLIKNLYHLNHALLHIRNAEDKEVGKLKILEGIRLWDIDESNKTLTNWFEGLMQKYS
ncbi:MAG: hypothetical protein ACOYT4_00740 [Nanoarchaeota archaeon]